MMMRHKNAGVALLMTFMVAALLTACGGGGGTTTAPTTTAPTTTAVAPTLSVTFTPPLGTPLLSTDTLTVTFPFAINTTSAVITPGGGTWNGTNTTYTFPVLSAGALNISIAAKDSATSKNIALTAGFSVYSPNKFVYVSPTGNDATGNGTINAPFATITKGIASAVAGQAVLVAAGTYNVNSGSSTNVVVKDGVSLFGGYSAAFLSRDPAANVTAITDVATAAATTLIVTDYGTYATQTPNSGSAKAGTPMAAVSVGTLTVPLQIDGFTINGSTSASTVDSAAISDSNIGAGFLAVTNSTLNGGAGSAHSVGIYSSGSDTINLLADTLNGGGSAGMSMGIYQGMNTLNSAFSAFNGGSAPVNVGVYDDDISGLTANLSNNVIAGGSGAKSFGYYAIDNMLSYTYISMTGNTILGGSGTTSSIAVHAQEWAPVDASNNLVNGGTGGVSVGFDLTDGSYADILYNNTINGGAGASSSVAVNYVHDAGSGPAPDIENNILFTTATAGNRVCFSSGTTSTLTPLAFNNNDLYNCPTALYIYITTTPGVTASVTDLVTAATVNGVVTTLGALGNVSLTPGFVSSSDWHLTSGSPANVQQGGANLTASASLAVPYDKDGNTRTSVLTLGPTNTGATGVSIGAYEQ